jgi:hypothetical protein
MITEADYSELILGHTPADWFAKHGSNLRSIRRWSDVMGPRAKPQPIGIVLRVLDEWQVTRPAAQASPAAPKPREPYRQSGRGAPPAKVEELKRRAAEVIAIVRAQHPQPVTRRELMDILQVSHSCFTSGILCQELHEAGVVCKTGFLGGRARSAYRLRGVAV